MRLLVVVPLVIAAGLHVDAGAQESGGAPRFETYCSRTQPGSSVAEVQWPLAKPSGETKLDTVVQQQVLDVTVYKDGFTRGLYKTVKPGVANPQFLLFKPQETQQIPGLQNLKLTQFATSQEQPKQGLRMLMRPMPGAQASGVAKLEGLEPGMKYFVRISSPDLGQKTVSFTAPVCPVDYVQPRGQ
jgi:hypothetical protein